MTDADPDPAPVRMRGVAFGAGSRPASGAAVSRRLVLLGAVAGVAGCTAAPAGGPEPAATTGIPSASSSTVAPGSASSSPTSSSATALAPSAAALPASRVWVVPPNEPEPAVKERAVRVVEALTAWPPGEAGDAAVAARVAALGVPQDRAAAVATAGQVFGRSAAEATSAVVMAEYGGVEASTAAVSVLFEQRTRDPSGAVVHGGSAASVDLQKRADTWTVTAVNPARPDPALTPAPALVQAVLTNPRIHLPPSAAADIAAGDLRPKAMQVMLDLARSYDLDLGVVFSAHTPNVFGTSHLSDHTRHRAFDIWAVNRQPVIASSTPDALVDGFLRDASAAGAYNLGGPRPLRLPGYFTDPSHRDHCHIAVGSDT